MTNPDTEAMTVLAKRVTDRMAELGLSQAEVARRGRFNRAFVSDLLVGRKTKLRDHNYARLAQALLTTPKYLHTGVPPSLEELALLGAEGLLPVPAGEEQPISEDDLDALAQTFTDLQTQQSRRIDPIADARRPAEWGKTPAVPLFRSEGRYDGAAVIRNPAAEMIRGPQSATASGWYAIAIADSTMAPRYEPSEFVYALEATQVRPKDFVVVRVASRVGKASVQLAYVRQLLRRTAEEVVVRQLSPSIETVIKSSVLIGVDRIVLAGEIIGESTI